MARPTSYTPEQDAIILSTKDHRAVNERFTELGYEPRTSGSIAGRRAYLMRLGEEATNAMAGPERLQSLVRMRDQLQVELDRARADTERLETEVASMNRRIKDLLGELNDALDLEPA